LKVNETFLVLQWLVEAESAEAHRRAPDDLEASAVWTRKY